MHKSRTQSAGDKNLHCCKILHFSIINPLIIPNNFTPEQEIKNFLETVLNSASPLQAVNKRNYEFSVKNLYIF